MVIESFSPGISLPKMGIVLIFLKRCFLTIHRLESECCWTMVGSGLLRCRRSRLLPIRSSESSRIGSCRVKGKNLRPTSSLRPQDLTLSISLAPMEIRGLSGIALREAWDGDDARAFLGLTIPDYPNLFCLYGPNTQAGHGGSLLLMVEAQIHYMMSILRQMSLLDLGTIEVRRDVFDDYNRRVDEAHANMVWTHEGMSVYYRNSRGRVVVNNPFRVVDFWKMTRDADLGQYLVEPSRSHTRSQGSRLERLRSHSRNSVNLSPLPEEEGARYPG